MLVVMLCEGGRGRIHSREMKNSGRHESLLMMRLLYDVPPAFNHVLLALNKPK